MRPRRPPLATAALVLATIGVSFSAVFIRLAHEGAATIVWARMALATALLAPLATRGLRAAMPRPRLRDALTMAVAGAFLAVHFLLWTASLAYTSVAASVLLVSLHPLIVAPLGGRVLGEHPSARTYTGMAVAIAGTVVTCAADVHLGLRPLLGDLMALGGAVCLAAYLLIGRRMRATTGVAVYSAAVYATTAVIAAVVVGLSGTAHLPSPRTLLLCLALAVACTICGHTLYTFALRRVHAMTVSIAFLGEPPLAAVLALVLLGSRPPLSTVAGGVLILAGLALALTVVRSQSSSQTMVAFEQA